MAAIRGKHTKSTEVVLRMALVRAKISGWRLHASDLPGKPDFYFAKSKVAIFVDGCFWHGCHYCGHIPKTRRSFWQLKIMRNKQRDRATSRKLRAQGLVVMRFWEHSLASEKTIIKVLKQISGIARR